MIVARWQIDAKFGHKSQVIDSIKRWAEEIGTQIGWKSDQMRMTTGSVGAKESTVVTEIELENMTELDESWDKLQEIEAHKRWSKDLEQYIVSGSHRWEIYRVI